MQRKTDTPIDKYLTVIVTCAAMYTPMPSIVLFMFNTMYAMFPGVSHDNTFGTT